MTEWYEQPYEKGQAVKVKGFPRPLYPPDADKKPSVNGPDVVAYKRTVSRAGRWPWQSFDDTYSNGFAHGTSGNVANTGVAGVQRQQHLDATGWIGTKTFNALRSIRVPDGNPHSGEMCMDAVAIDLINQAWDMFGGVEPAPVEPTSFRNEVLKKAIEELGTTESPFGSNRNKYGDWYGMNGVPWCAIFCTWCAEQAGGSASFAKGSHYAYVPYIVSDARKNANGLRTVDDPIPGDLVCFDWEKDTVYDHVGLFEKWIDANSFSAIEGNTSTSSNSNGGQVMRRSRSNQLRVVFVRYQ